MCKVLLNSVLFLHGNCRVIMLQYYIMLKFYFVTHSATINSICHKMDEISGLNL